MTSEAPDGLPPRQVFIKCSGSGARLMTHVGAVEEFFSEDAISVVNAWGETPADGKLQVVALVSFGDDAALERALARDGEVLDGQMVSIAKNAQPYRKRKRALGSVWVYVGNCPLDATDEALRQALPLPLCRPSASFNTAAPLGAHWLSHARDLMRLHLGAKVEAGELQRALDGALRPRQDLVERKRRQVEQFMALSPA